MMTMERAVKKIFKEIAAMDHVPSYEELKARYFPADVSEMESTAQMEEEEKPKKKAAPKKAAPKKKEEEAVSEDEGKKKCEGVTVKGLPCKKMAIAGLCFCSVHKPKEEGEEKKPKKKAANKEKKGEPLVEEEGEEESETPKKSKRSGKKAPGAPKKADPPVHTHEADEEIHEDCDMCQVYGNSAASGEESKNQKYDVSQDLKSRLANILDAIDGSEDELEEEADKMMDELLGLGNTQADEVDELEEESAADELEEEGWE